MTGSNNNNNNRSYCSLTLSEKQSLSVFEKIVLKEVFEFKRDEVTGVWRILHNEKQHDFSSSSGTIPVIKSRRIRFTVHMACMGRRQAHRGFWPGNLKDWR